MAGRCRIAEILFLDYGRSPFIGAKVTRMLGEKPVMSIQIDDAVLPFSIDCFVEILHNCGAFQFRSFEMSVDIVDKHGKTLRSIAEICG